MLAHVTTTLAAIERGAPVDLVFQSIAGTEAANRSFGIDLALLAEAHDAALSLQRGTVGDNVMYFETGQGSALSADAHHGVDQQTLEARAYAVARRFDPLLVNTVVGFIGPEYLYDGKQIIRAGLEDHFCGKLLGLPMGCDVCYTNHAEADQDDMDNLLTLLGVAGCNYVMGVPGADDIMLNYQSTSFHDALYVRSVLGLRPAPEFEAWLERMGLLDDERRVRALEAQSRRCPAPRRAGGAMTDSVTDPAPTAPDPWTALRRHTAARIGLGRAGDSFPTERAAGVRAGARPGPRRRARAARRRRPGRAARGAAGGRVRSAAQDRATYLQRPDLGRRLDPEASGCSTGARTMPPSWSPTGSPPAPSTTTRPRRCGPSWPGSTAGRSPRWFSPPRAGSRSATRSGSSSAPAWWPS